MKDISSVAHFTELSERELLKVTGGCVVNGHVVGYNPHPVIAITKVRGGLVIREIPSLRDKI